MPEPVDVEGQEEYVVERVLASRMHKGERQWLIHFLGTTDEQDMWLANRHINVGATNELWQEFEKRRLGSRYVDPHATAGRRTVKAALRAVKVWAVGAGGRKTKPFKVLVLCSGTGSVERALHKRYTNCWVVTVDVQPEFSPSHCMEIQQFVHTVDEWYGKGFFDLVWASPPCTEYSKALTRRPRNFQKADAVVMAVLEVIEKLQPPYFVIENPEGELRHRPCMRLLEPYKHLTSYCMWGTAFQKKTNLWTNLPGLSLPCCKAGRRCGAYLHEFKCHPVTAQSGVGFRDLPVEGKVSGSGNGVNVYPVPEGLVVYLVDHMAGGFQLRGRVRIEM